MNYLLIEALELYHDDESRKFAMDTASNIVSIFLPDADGRRPVHGEGGFTRDATCVPHVSHKSSRSIDV